MRAMDRFRQPPPRHHRRDERQRRRGPDRRRVADLGEHAAQRRAEDESHAERRADEPVGARAILRFGDVGHVCASRRNVAARKAVDDPRREEHRDAVRHGQHHEADNGTRQTEHEHGTPAIAIGDVAERGSGCELTDRKHGEQQTDDERRGAERFRVERQERNDDPESDQIHEDRQEDDEERPRHERLDILYNALI